MKLGKKEVIGGAIMAIAVYLLNTRPSPCASMSKRLSEYDRYEALRLAAGIKGASWLDRSVYFFTSEPSYAPYQINSLRAHYNKHCRPESEQQLSAGDTVSVVKKDGDTRVVIESLFNPSYGVNAETMAATRPSALGLFARDAGEMAGKAILPAIVIGGLVFGAVKAVETGDTSTVQRTWAMVVR